MTSVQATFTVDVLLSDQCQEIRLAVMFPDESINDVSAEGKDSIVEDMMAPQWLCPSLWVFCNSDRGLSVVIWFTFQPLILPFEPGLTTCVG